MAALQGSRAKVLAFRARGQHLATRLAGDEWVEALGVGAQDTPAGSGALALAARVEDVEADRWEAERVSARTIAVSWSLRGAPFGHLIEDHDLFSVAVRPLTDAGWLGLLHWTKATPGELGLSPQEAVERVAGEVEALLDRGPMTKADLSTALRDVLPPALLPWCRRCKVHHVPEQVLRAAALYGGFVFGDVVDGQDTLTRSDEWLNVVSRRRAGTAKAPRWAWRQPDERTARVQRLELIHRFLSAYGPADGELFAAWLGVAPAEGAARFTEAEEADRLVPARITGGAIGWLHVSDVEDFQVTKPADARGVRLVPPSDPWLQQRDRDLLVPDPARRSQVWRSTGSPGGLLVDGDLGGTWRAKKQGATLTITVTPFESLRAKDGKALDAEAETVARARGTGLAGVTVDGA